jgi:hypothetical protein
MLHLQSPALPGIMIALDIVQRYPLSPRLVSGIDIGSPVPV